MSDLGVLLPEFLETGADLFRTGKQVAGAAIDSISSTQLTNRASDFAGQVVERIIKEQKAIVADVDERVQNMKANQKSE